jgi:hypothetical protein
VIQTVYKPHVGVSQLSTRVLAAVAAATFNAADEREMQDGIEQLLGRAGLEFAREHRLGPRDVLDFYVAPLLAIEVKTKGTLAALTRQIFRYAEHDAVSELMVITSRFRLGAQLPTSVLGKPCTVVVLAGGIR